MGIAKQWMLEQFERGYMQADGQICANCVNDPALVQWVEDNATTTECSFCGTESDAPVAAEFDSFVGVVLTGIRFNWNHPDDEGIAYISAEGGYQASITDSREVLRHYDISDNEDVIRAIVRSIGDNGWVERDYYVGDTSQRLSWGWDHFKEVVKHQTRYVFLTPEDDDHSEVPPSQMLAAIGSTIVEDLSDLALITTVPTDADLIRIRIGAGTYATGAEIGTPPAQFANQSNRMSPAGIPMFYGAFDVDTARAETLDPHQHGGQIMSIGSFRAVRDLKVLDLADLPDIPSVFWEGGHQLIHPLRFLHAFAGDIVQPIARDGREHIEYVPTQVVTEYFRRVFRDADDRPIDGIVYSSSRHPGGRAFVLFCENEQCGGDSELGLAREQIVTLVGVQHLPCP